MSPPSAEQASSSSEQRASSQPGARCTAVGSAERSARNRAAPCCAHTRLRRHVSARQQRHQRSATLPRPARSCSALRTQTPPARGPAPPAARRSGSSGARVGAACGAGSDRAHPRLRARQHGHHARPRAPHVGRIAHDNARHASLTPLSATPRAPGVGREAWRGVASHPAAARRRSGGAECVRRPTRRTTKPETAAHPHFCALVLARAWLLIRGVTARVCTALRPERSGRRYGGTPRRTRARRLGAAATVLVRMPRKPRLRRLWADALPRVQLRLGPRLLAAPVVGGISQPRHDLQRMPYMTTGKHDGEPVAALAG